MAGLQLDDAIREYANYIDRRPNSSIGFFGRGFARMLKGDRGALSRNPATSRSAEDVSGGTGEKGPLDVFGHWRQR